MPKFISALFLALPFFNFPDLLGWIFFAGLFGLGIWLYFKSRETRIKWDRRAWLIFIALLIFTPISNLFIGVYIKGNSLMSWPGVPFDPPGTALMLFSALPWILAGGLLGPLPAFILGMVAGILRAPFDTHTVFTAVQFGLMGLLFNRWVRQRYRTPAYKFLRQPIVSALALTPIFSLLFVPGMFFSASHSDITARLDFALNNVGVATLAVFGELLVAGFIAQILAFSAPVAWGRKIPLSPSPAERRIETRFLIGTGTFIIVLLLTLLIGDWIVAGRAARQMLYDRLENTAQVAAESVPFFLETGQNLSTQLAEDQALLSEDTAALATLLGEKIRLVPYFTQLLVVDSEANILGEYPPSDALARELTTEEINGLILSASGVPSQIYTIPPITSGGTARISFIATIPGNKELPARVLIGRTDLSTNPITRPLLNSLDGMASISGDGFLVNENGTILYHSNSSLTMSQYEGEKSDEANLFDATSPTGTRTLVFYQPVIGRPWAVVLTVPARQVQQLSLQIASPLSAMIVILTIFALIALRIGLRIISQSLENLASEAGRIAQGQLDRPLALSGIDEVGQLRRAFEQMRVSLKDRLEELNQLLVVSNSVAASLEMKYVFQPVLDAIKSTGASAVHVVLSPEIIPDAMFDMPTRFAMEATKGQFAHLDVELLDAVRYEEKIVLPNLARTTGGLQLNENRPNPAALIALPLRNEKNFYGVLWAAYAQPKLFTEANVRFISTLGGQAAFAAANAHLFLNEEVGRQQLAAILSSTSDPILVTDHQDRLTLANPAALKALEIVHDESTTQFIENIIHDKALANLLKISNTSRTSAEITLPSGQVLLATASSIITEGQSIGRVCILRDVTHFKELDTLKSEFVSTVSHDLRSPLTLMRGYATMMPMAGELNEQQQGYVTKIISGVESMSRLVNNLLDLGRIELGVGLQLEKISPLDILDRVSTGLHTNISQKKINFSIETAQNLPGLIEADQALLHQAVYNLVENAIKYTPEGGNVNVRAYAIERDIVFEIEDSGIGISEEAKKRLFEKFFRSSQRAARAQQGTGLGLAIVRSIAERHGGRVWVESIEGKGSTFYLEVPIQQSIK